MADSKILPLEPEARSDGAVARTPTQAAGGKISESCAKAMLSAASPSLGAEWSPPSPGELQRGLSHYEVLSLIARGGMGAIYKGRHLRLDRLVAIKVLPPEGNNHAMNFAERFKQEARAMAQFSHPCIVPVYDAGETWDGLLYFVMEFVEGANVDQMIAARGKLPQGEAARIAAAVCEALAYAHGRGVIHRDIKPSNVIVNKEEQVKVADFGLAKLPPAVSTTVTTANVNIGTLGFMAPEAFTPGIAVDHRADIYAVGAMLYQMLTGKLPQGVFDLPSKLVPGLDVRFDRIIARAMKADRDARYSSAAELRAEIAPMIPGQAAAPRRSGAAMWIGLSVVAALALGGIAISGRRKTDASGANRAGILLAQTSKEKPFVNSLGMEFVPVPGNAPLFCRWETRVKDYAAFARVNTVDGAWKTQRKEQADVAREPEHPVAGASWEEARAFCEWLTEKEITEGRLPLGSCYRLPSDEEWSRAAGLGQEVGASPKERTGNNGVDFPWGTGFPPPNEKAGNYADSAFHEKFPNVEWLDGYTDGYATTAPVGSFPPNDYGIHDLGGNVWEWCEDLYEPGGAERVMRGGSWVTYGRNSMASSFRLHAAPDSHAGVGFRCVLATSAGRWTRPFPDLEKIAGIHQADNGWVRCKPDAPGLLATTARGGSLVMRNGGVCVRFRGRPAGTTNWAKLEIRKGATTAVPALRYIQPGGPGAAAEMRIELTLGGGKKFVTLGTARVETALREGEEYSMELYAIGSLLVGRINQQTLTARIENSAVPAEGALGIWGVDRNFFRDFEVINLDGLSEADALKLIAIGKK